MQKFRLIDHKDEIFKMALKAPVIQIGQVWQTLPVKREVYQIKKLEVLSEAMIFHTTLPFSLDHDFPIYIQLNYKNLIFKLSPKEFRTFNNQLSCSYPKEAQALEERALVRTQLPKKSTLHLTLRTLSTGSALDIKVSIENISETGLGIKVSRLNEEYFKRNSFFKIVQICGRNVLEETTLTVRHISAKEHKSFIGVGLSGSLPFSDRLFAILREEIKKERFAAI